MIKYELGEEMISAEKIVEKVVNSISEANYSKITEIVDDLDCLTISEIEECAEGFKSINHLERFDSYGIACSFKPKYEYHQLKFYKWNDGNGMSCEYDLTTDGDLNDLTLMIDFYYEENMLRSVFKDLHVL
ncbi:MULTISPECIES: hypothetical protein [Clostridium]|uniref:DUF7668 domain-containing protein n=1 Tax=Clostridium TaxID=1485 RepID=UPI0013FECF7E|nr:MULTISPECIES: hypothetical protein [Clostridium]MBY6915767.1 hypothetical protein [Clostridium botulinum]NFI53310.1 hypothetical protein [Clostridium botulinum]NFO39223.1 hypothetical protein [Clostridium botulinum]NFQ40157.1 hypothetical protein [Clostridium botulinum]